MRLGTLLWSGNENRTCLDKINIIFCNLSSTLLSYSLSISVNIVYSMAFHDNYIWQVRELCEVFV